MHRKSLAAVPNIHGSRKFTLEPVTENFLCVQFTLCLHGIIADSHGNVRAYLGPFSTLPMPMFPSRIASPARKEAGYAANSSCSQKRTPSGVLFGDLNRGKGRERARQGNDLNGGKGRERSEQRHGNGTI